MPMREPPRVYRYQFRLLGRGLMGIWDAGENSTGTDTEEGGLMDGERGKAVSLRFPVR